MGTIFSDYLPLNPNPHQRRPENDSRRDEHTKHITSPIRRIP